MEAKNRLRHQSTCLLHRSTNAKKTSAGWSSFWLRWKDVMIPGGCMLVVRPPFTPMFCARPNQSRKHLTRPRLLACVAVQRTRELAWKSRWLQRLRARNRWAKLFIGSAAGGQADVFWKPVDQEHCRIRGKIQVSKPSKVKFRKGTEANLRPIQLISSLQTPQTHNTRRLHRQSHNITAQIM
jgi:hypothetical protein